MRQTDLQIEVKRLTNEKLLLVETLLSIARDPGLFPRKRLELIAKAFGVTVTELKKILVDLDTDKARFKAKAAEKKGAAA